MSRHGGCRILPATMVAAVAGGRLRPGGRGVRWAAWALAAALLAALPVAAQAAERVALVIGNSAYHDPGAELRNPGNDADGMAAALGRLGFEVVLGKDLDFGGFRDTLDEFQEAAREADVTLFFYAGHGLQANGRNWLVPTDARLEKELDLVFRAVALDHVLNAMRGTKLVFLDACRNNPLAREMARSMGLSRALADEAATRGLARVEAESGSGMLIAYATAPDDVADDGAGRNSPFTAALLEHIAAPGVSVDDMLTKVAKSVRNATGNAQRPWKNSSLPEVFYFKPIEEPTADSVAGGTLPPSGDVARAYEAAERLGTVAAYRVFMENFPGGFHAQLAQAQIDKLEKEVAGGAAPAPSSPEEAERRAQTPGAKFRDCPDCPEMVVVPAGSFTMGSPSSERGRGGEGPQRRVTISQPFAVGVYEVTFAQWDGCVAIGGCGGYRPDNLSGAGRGRHPVIHVSWEDAQAYLRWLSGKTGAEYRLLSESEWEYAARAGTVTARYWGEGAAGQCRYANGADLALNRVLSDHGVWWDHEIALCDDGAAWPAFVGSYEANGFGLHDVMGNVQEWVADCWNGSYAGAPTDGSAWETGDCEKRILRGGDWGYPPGFLRSAFRSRNEAGDRDGYHGFRVARTLAP